MRTRLAALLPTLKSSSTKFGLEPMAFVTASSKKVTDRINLEKSVMMPNKMRTNNTDICKIDKKSQV